MFIEYTFTNTASPPMATLREKKKKNRGILPSVVAASFTTLRVSLSYLGRSDLVLLSYSIYTYYTIDLDTGF